MASTMEEVYLSARAEALAILTNYQCAELYSLDHPNWASEMLPEHDEDIKRDIEMGEKYFGFGDKELEVIQYEFYQLQDSTAGIDNSGIGRPVFLISWEDVEVIRNECLAFFEVPEEAHSPQ